jgi:hypothetical protein
MNAREVMKLIDTKDALELAEEELRQAVENLRKEIDTLIDDDVDESFRAPKLTADDFVYKAEGIVETQEKPGEGDWANYVVAFIAILNVVFLFKITVDFLGF